MAKIFGSESGFEVLKPICEYPEKNAMHEFYKEVQHSKKRITNLGVWHTDNSITNCLLKRETT